MISREMFSVKENISKLNDKEVFVFGSNDQGYHASGAARVAMDVFGAKIGIGIGFCNEKTYGIPTVIWTGSRGVADLNYIQEHVNNFYGDALKNPDLKFLVTQIGCGIAGYTAEQIAPLFNKFYLNPLPNVFFPEKWVNYVRSED